MGKYTDIARKHAGAPQRGEGVTNIDNVNINSIYSDKEDGVGKPTSDHPERTLQGRPLVEKRQDVASGGKGEDEDLAEGVTPLRGNAVNAVIRCIHGKASNECAVCSGYTRWLITDEGRLRRAERNPEAVRREFWQSVRGGGA